MGIPKFFRWVSERYPLILQNIDNTSPLEIPEFDNLYLDCNGIIHNSIYGPNDQINSYEEMITRVMNYVEKLISVIRPKKLLYIALDGVAPRAKMNQQRSRRFKSARERLQREESEHLQLFDSNCITPGTEFMVKLSAHFYYFIKSKQNSSWRDFKVIFSGTETPGEGEHKILNYIRFQKSLPDFNPNTTHCLYGLDADLIMLGLVTHEPHFSILREVVTNQPKRRTKAQVKKNEPASVPFQLLHLCILREYLNLEFEGDIRRNFPNFEYSIERVVDDFVFMCFFVGNDFLPNLPYCAIHGNTISHLITIYKMVIGCIGDYLINKGKMNLLECEIFFKIFSCFERRELKKLSAKRDNRRDDGDEEATAEIVLQYIKNLQKLILEKQFGSKEELLSWVKEYTDTNDTETTTPWVNPDQKPNNNNADNDDDEDDDNNNDDSDKNNKIDDSEAEAEEEEVVNGEGDIVCVIPPIDVDTSTWKLNYYYATQRFQEEEVEEKRNVCISSYVEGLSWVLQYYYYGCPSWKWFFPFHYAPLISDLNDLRSLKTEFPENTEPFTPVQQLLAVLPLASVELLPVPYRKLMRDSPISYYYPQEFEIEIPANKPTC